MMNQDDIICISKLKENIAASVTPFQTVNHIENTLRENGFEKLDLESKFKLENGNKYYLSVYDTTLIAFTIGENLLHHEQVDVKEPSLRIVCSHTDYPCFKLKPSFEIRKQIKNQKNIAYTRINTETYGGPILNTWMDRPLSLAGKVVSRGEDIFHPKSTYIDFSRPIFTIPNLAIHMNRQINKGIELNKQKDLLPIADCINEKLSEKTFLAEIAKLANVDIEDILDFELFVYLYEQGEIVGLNQSLFSSPRLDNMTSVYAELEAIVHAKRQNGINMAVFFDNEEIGSRTKQGAASNILNFVLEKIYLSLNIDRQQMFGDILSGMILSVDVAHAMHPNAEEKSDITNHVMLNNGVVIKQAANQSYASDATSVAIVKEIAKKRNVDIQVFVNRSDMVGGQTLGSIVSSGLPMRTVDIGVPILAMHSAREVMGIHDQKNIENLLTGFYS